MISKNVLPSPLEVLSALRDISVHPFAGAPLLVHLTASLERFFSGFLLAIATGIPVGLMMGRFAVFRNALAPFFETFRFIAPLAWVPFAALWFGTGIGGPILIVFSAAFAACVINTFRGVQLVDPYLVESSKALGANTWRLMVDVFLPGAIPSIMVGVRISAALAWQSLIGAELIAASSGVGYVIVQGQGSDATAIVMAAMIVIGAIGLLIDGLLRLLDSSIGHRWRTA
jgi:NitT/TauT family transport system permease protein